MDSVSYKNVMTPKPLMKFDIQRSKALVLALIFSMVVPNNGLGHSHSTRDLSPVWEQARIAGTELWLEMSQEELEEAIMELANQGVNAFYLDVGITGQYERFLNPDEAVHFVERASELTHAHGMQVFVYLSGLEIITYDTENKEHSVLQSHRDWIQQDVNGHLAVFDSDYADEYDIHWLLEENIEDTWITPFNPEWRAQYMEIVRKLAATGVDALYVDTAYWQTHFPGWHNSWASFDPYTTEAFTKKTGLNPPTTQTLGDWSDLSFYTWALFRRHTITDFLADIKANATSITPQITIIAECFPTFTRHALTTGADPMYLWDTVDLVTHEFGLRQGEGGADTFSQWEWWLQVAAMLVLRGIDRPHPSWILSYASSPAASAALAATEIMLGCNFWETEDPSMLGTVGESYRKTLFNWIETYEAYLYADWETPHAIGVYFSPNSRDFVFYPDRFIEDDDELQYIGGPHVLELLGTVILAYRSHVPVKVVTHRDLPTLDRTCELLYLPNVAAMSDEEAELIKQYAVSHPLISTGATSRYYEDGQERANHALIELVDQWVTPDTLQEVEGDEVFSVNSPGYDFFRRMFENETISPSHTPEEDLFLELLEVVGYQNPIQTDAPPSVVLLPYSRGGTLTVRVVNLSELGNGRTAPEPVTFGITLMEGAASVASIEQVDLESAAILVAQEGSFQVISFVVIPRNWLPYMAAGFIAVFAVNVLVRKIRKTKRK